MKTNRLRRIGLLCTLVAMAYGGGAPGIRPRASADDYPAHFAANGFVIGAAAIPAGDVKKIFTVDLNAAGYAVVEVGIFPEAGREIDVSPGDFTLLSDADKVSARPVDAEAIASVVGRKYDPPRVPKQSDVYVTGGVTVDHTPSSDPSLGRRGNGTIVGTQAGVGVGPNYPAAPGPSGPRMSDVEQELWQKSLPDGKTRVPVTGYLYFPKPAGKAKAGPWQLNMDGQAGRVKLTLR